ncbi:hypothetical protein HY251_21000 [bacterium]|nr:hypothetical protein [bacterium]
MTTKRTKKDLAWDVYEINDYTNAPIGKPLASFATHPEAEAFVRGIQFHDPKTRYGVMPASKRKA